MANHHRILARTIMSQLSTCRFNEKKQRFEASANGIKNIGYGGTKEEATSMLSKIVENHVLDRPELENMEEHEAANLHQAGASRMHSVINNVNNINNVQGILVTGSVGGMHNVSVSVQHSIANLMTKEVEMADKLNDFVEAAKKSEELSENAKIEVIDHTDVIAVEAAKPKEERLPHRSVNALKGIAEVLKGCAALKSVWDIAEPLVKAHLNV